MSATPEKRSHCLSCGSLLFLIEEKDICDNCIIYKNIRTDALAQAGEAFKMLISDGLVWTKRIIPKDPPIKENNTLLDQNLEMERKLDVTNEKDTLITEISQMTLGNNEKTAMETNGKCSLDDCEPITETRLQDMVSIPYQWIETPPTEAELKMAYELAADSSQDLYSP
jgi:hypothetical protein